MFALIAGGLVGAICGAAIALGYGPVAVVAGLPIGASLGVVVTGLLLAVFRDRRDQAACKPGHIRRSVQGGLGERFAPPASGPLPPRLKNLADRLKAAGPA